MLLACFIVSLLLLSQKGLFIDDSMHFLIISFLTFPNYLTYTSPLAGGSDRAWDKLSDSNLETGQR